MSSQENPGSHDIDRSEFCSGNQHTALIDINNSELVQKAKMAAELERQIFLQACAEELRTANASDRRFLELQASQVANTTYENELIGAIEQIEADKQQIKQLIQAVQIETQAMLEKLNQLKKDREQ